VQGSADDAPGETRRRAAPQVLLADDHALLLAALRRFLADECDIVGQVTDGRAAVAAAETLKPELVILDIAMPLLNGLDAAREIKRRCPEIKLIVLTMSESGDLAAEAFRAGASAYVLKRSAPSELVSAIRRVVRGETYVTPLLASALMTSLVHAEQDKGHRGPSPRQREVLQLLAEGHTMKEVAALLSVTPRTVAFHKYQMMRQLELKSTAELIQYAVKQRLVF
jgi:DNA-binding NarL/FixJ family response regulator